jgi:hypothetical protein
MPSNLSSGLSKFKAKKKLQINIMSKQQTKKEMSKEFISFTPTNEDIQRDTSLEFGKGSKVSVSKKKAKMGEKKIYSSIMGSKLSKNISILSKKSKQGNSLISSWEESKV